MRTMLLINCRKEASTKETSYISNGPTLSTVLVSIMLALFSASSHAAEHGLAPIIDNDRVTVLDVTLVPDKPWFCSQQTDFVEMFLVGGKIRTTRTDGSSSSISRETGDVVYVSAGSVKQLESLPPSAARIVVVELKDVSIRPLPNNSGYPLAFPRPGSTKILENQRVLMWECTWILGVPTPMHYHNKDVVTVFLSSGKIRSTNPKGDIADTTDEFGTIRFTKGDRTHFEELVEGNVSAIILELK